MLRDFTYVENIVKGISKVLFRRATVDSMWHSDNPDPTTTFAPHRIFNIGNNQPVQLMNCIAEIETYLDQKAKINFLPIQQGDVPAVDALVKCLEEWTGYVPSAKIKEGVKHFIDWFRRYYNK